MNSYVLTFMTGIGETYLLHFFTERDGVGHYYGR